MNMQMNDYLAGSYTSTAWKQIHSPHKSCDETKQPFNQSIYMSIQIPFI